MTQAGKAVIDQQEGTKAGASGDDLGAPFFLSALGEGRTYSPPASGRWWYCLTAAVRPPGGLPGCPPLPVYTSRRRRRLVHRTQLRRSPGAWGPSTTNKLRQVYTGALLATTISAYK